MNLSFIDLNRFFMSSCNFVSALHNKVMCDTVYIKREITGGIACQPPVYQRPQHARLQSRSATGQRPTVSRATAVTATGALNCIYPYAFIRITRVSIIAYTCFGGAVVRATDFRSKRSLVHIQAGTLSSHLGQLSLPSLRPGFVNRVPALLVWG